MSTADMKYLLGWQLLLCTALLVPMANPPISSQSQLFGYSRALPQSWQHPPQGFTVLSCPLQCAREEGQPSEGGQFWANMVAWDVSCWLQGTMQMSPKGTAVACCKGRWWAELESYGKTWIPEMMSWVTPGPEVLGWVSSDRFVQVWGTSLLM